MAVAIVSYLTPDSFSVNPATGTVDFVITKLNEDGTETELFNDSIPSSTPYVISSAFGVYLITNATDVTEERVVLMFGSILDYLKEKVKEILLNIDNLGIKPNLYDIVLLTLFASTIFYSTLENSIQDIADKPTYVLELIDICIALNHCTKYMDLKENTPQSTNKIW